MGFIEDVGLTRREDELVVHMVFSLLIRYTESNPGAPSLPELLQQASRLDDLPLVERHAGTIFSSLVKHRLITSEGRSLAGGLSNNLALTAAGRTEGARIRQLQQDVAARRRACRIALLLWLYDDDSTRDDPAMATIAAFFGSHLSFFWGEQFTIKDVAAAGRWLREHGFVKGIEFWGGEIARAQITTKGVDCVERDEGNITAYIERATMSGGQTINVHGPNSGQIGMARDGNVSQTQQQGVDIEKLVEALNGVREALPVLKLEKEDESALTEAMDEVEAKGRSGALTGEEKKSMLKRIGALIAKSASSMAPLVQGGLEQLIS
ncbi:hypothetical protein AB0B89_27120 [Sphaerisporangium sp. NPDC049002]|uniref:hypothetical protein n=1 Tax=Sphaerisporangium sp. NPDC049002 TaxID=3155392 RepID=UPI0033CE4647